MKPGRELDALIAEKVMGHQVRMLNVVTNNAFKKQSDVPVINYDNGNYENIPHYSTSIADAWLVVECFDIARVERFAGEYLCEICDPICVRIVAETAPLAICLASLKVVGVSVDG